MKKILLFLTAAALLLAGCKKVENEVLVPEPENKTEKVILSASIDEGTRVSADAEGNYAWQPGDRIVVHMTGAEGDRYVPFTATTTESASTTDFSGEKLASEEFGQFAFYPAPDDADQLVNYNVGVNNVDFFLSHQYFFLEDYVEDATNMPMLGTISANGDTFSAKFKSVGGLLKLIVYNVPSDADYFQLSVPDKMISGVFPVSNGQINVVSYDDNFDGTNTIDIFFRDNRKTNMVFYFPLPCGTYNSFTFSFFSEMDGENPIFTKTASMGGSGLQVHRNEIIVPSALNAGGSTAKDLFEETFGDYTGSVASYDFRGTTVYDNDKTSLSYSVSNNQVKIDDATSSTITTNNVYFPGAQNDFIISGIKLHGASSITVSYEVNKANMNVYYKVDDGDFITARSGSSVGANSFTKTVSGTNLTLKFSNPSTSTNNRLDNIKVVSAGTSVNTPVISTNSESATIAADKLSASINGVRITNPLDGQGIVATTDADWLTLAFEGTQGFEAGKKLVATATDHNYDADERIATVTLSATGATKTVTIKQTSSLIPNPTLTAVPGNGTFSITWTGHDKADTYVGYYSENELPDPMTGTPLSITFDGDDYTATPSATVEGGQLYHIYVKVASKIESATAYHIAEGWATTEVTPRSVTSDQTSTINVTNVNSAHTLGSGAYADYKDTELDITVDGIPMKAKNICKNAKNTPTGATTGGDFIQFKANTGYIKNSSAIGISAIVIKSVTAPVIKLGATDSSLSTATVTEGATETVHGISVTTYTVTVPTGSQYFSIEPTSTFHLREMVVTYSNN